MESRLKTENNDFQILFMIWVHTNNKILNGQTNELCFFCGFFQIWSDLEFDVCNTPSVKRFIGNRWVSWFATKGASLKGSVVHEQRLRKFYGFLRTTTGGNSPRTFPNTQLYTQFRDFIIYGHSNVLESVLLQMQLLWMRHINKHVLYCIVYLNR